jgi:hypothetical protein
MNNLFLALSVYFILFFLLWISVLIGYKFGLLKERKDPKSTSTGIVKVAEATVFALLGLLVAFTFAGSYDRFENRKYRIMDEINYIHTAYDRISLLRPDLQPGMRKMFKQYINSRIDTYNRLAEFRGFKSELGFFEVMSDSLWERAAEAAKLTNNNATTILFLPAVNNMLEMANTRILLTRIHPPAQIFVLLIGLAALSSFLAGFSMARNKNYSQVYTLCFIAVMAYTLYVIIDLEYPRIGMIRVGAFDAYLVEMRDNLK